MAELGFELILRFLWGSLLVLSTVSRKETSERFPRIAAYISLGCALFAAWLALGLKGREVESLACLGALVLGIFLYAFFSGRILRIVGFLLFAFAPLPFWWRQDFGTFFNFISSGLLFGSVFTGQYLGHWFLTVPGLNIRELQKVSRLLIFFLGIKTLELSFTLFVKARQMGRVFEIDDMGRPLLQLNESFSHGLEGDVWLGLGLFASLLLVSRILWGLLAPWILCFMVKKTVDIRSTQSATGILYALCVMIIIGEGAALYLKKALGWNL